MIIQTQIREREGGEEMCNAWVRFGNETLPVERQMQEKSFEGDQQCSERVKGFNLSLKLDAISLVISISLA